MEGGGRFGRGGKEEEVLDAFLSGKTPFSNAHHRQENEERQHCVGGLLNDASLLFFI